MSDLGEVRSRILHLLNQAYLEPDLQQKGQALDEIQELLVNTPTGNQLLFELLESMLELHIDPNVVVRKFVVGLIDKVCKLDMKYSRVCAPTLANLCADDNPGVCSKAIGTASIVFKIAFHCMCQVKKEDPDLASWMASWEALKRILGDVCKTKLVHKSHDAVRLVSIKFLETVAMLFLPSLPEDPQGPRRKDEPGVDHVPADHPFFKSSDLSSESDAILNLLLARLSNPDTAATNGVAILHALGNVVRTRSCAWGKIVPAISDYVPSRSMPETQAASIVHALKQTLILLLKIPGVSRYRIALKVALDKLGAKEQAEQAIKYCEKVMAAEAATGEKRPLPPMEDEIPPLMSPPHSAGGPPPSKRARGDRDRGGAMSGANAIPVGAHAPVMPMPHVQPELFDTPLGRMTLSQLIDVVVEHLPFLPNHLPVMPPPMMGMPQPPPIPFVPPQMVAPPPPIPPPAVIQPPPQVLPQPSAPARKDPRLGDPRLRGRASAAAPVPSQPAVSPAAMQESPPQFPSPPSAGSVLPPQLPPVQPQVAAPMPIEIYTPPTPTVVTPIQPMPIQPISQPPVALPPPTLKIASAKLSPAVSSRLCSLARGRVLSKHPGIKALRCVLAAHVVLSRYKGLPDQAVRSGEIDLLDFPLVATLACQLYVRGASRYDPFLSAYFEALIDMVGDNKLPLTPPLSRFLVHDLPKFGENAFLFLDNLITGFVGKLVDQMDGAKGSPLFFGLGTLRDLIFGRPAIAGEALGRLLGFSENPQEAIRNPAIRLLANKLYAIPELANPILEHARNGLFSLIQSVSSEGGEALSSPQVNLNEQGGSDGGGEPVRMETDTQESSGQLPQASSTSTSGLDESEVKRRVALHFALCTKNPSLIDPVFDVYASSDSTVKRSIHKEAADLARTLSATAQGIEAISEVVTRLPTGAEPLVLQFAQIAVELGKESMDQLHESIRNAFEKSKDAKFIIPIAPFLSQDAAVEALPHICRLPTPKLVSLAITRLCAPIAGGAGAGSAPTAPPLQPSDVLVHLHTMDPERLPLLKAKEAIDVCLTLKGLFKQEVVTAALQHLAEASPLPKLLVRTIMQVRNIYPKTVGFIYSLMSRLVQRQVWNDPILWEGFVKCAKMSEALSPVLLTLPRPQLEKLISDQPDSVQLLQTAVQRAAKRGGSAATQPKWLLVALGLAEKPDQPSAEEGASTPERGGQRMEEKEREKSSASKPMKIDFGGSDD